MSNDLKEKTKPQVGGGWDAHAVTEMLARQREKDDAQHEAFQQALGEPDLVLTDGDGNERGLFRVEGGVFMIERRKNGFHWHERRAFTDDEILALVQVAALPAVRAVGPLKT